MTTYTCETGKVVTTQVAEILHWTKIGSRLRPDGLYSVDVAFMAPHTGASGILHLCIAEANPVDAEVVAAFLKGDIRSLDYNTRVDLFGFLGGV